MKKEGIFKVIGVIATVFILFAGVPLILEYLIFRNNVYSVLSNGEWGSFLGSYIGGIIGGTGTLIAMYVTTKETRKVQEENLNQLKEDRLLEDKKERKVFADGIAHDISVYSTDITKYFHACRNVDRLDMDRYNANMQLQNIQNRIQEKYTRRKMMNVSRNSETYLSIESEIKQLQDEESKIRYKLEHIENEIHNIQGDRRIAVECYFILKIKLQSIKEAHPLLEQLEYIHENSSNVKGTHLEFAKEETQKLLDLTVAFIDKYINQIAS